MRALHALFQIRYISLVAVVSSLLGAFLMFVVGAVRTVQALLVFFGLRAAEFHELEVDLGLETTIRLVESLDSFLFGFVLLYFGFGMYSLFVIPDSGESEKRIKVAPWLEVNSLGQMKRTLLEVIVVLLAVLFVKGVLTTDEIPWTALVIPITIVSLALSLKLIGFEAE